MFGSVREEVEEEASLSRPLAAGKAALRRSRRVPTWRSAIGSRFCFSPIKRITRPPRSHPRPWRDSRDIRGGNFVVFVLNIKSMSVAHANPVGVGEREDAANYQRIKKRLIRLKARLKWFTRRRCGCVLLCVCVSEIERAREGWRQGDGDRHAAPKIDT